MSSNCCRVKGLFTTMTQQARFHSDMDVIQFPVARLTMGPWSHVLPPVGSHGPTQPAACRDNLPATLSRLGRKAVKRSEILQCLSRSSPSSLAEHLCRFQMLTWSASGFPSGGCCYHDIHYGLRLRFIQTARDNGFSFEGGVGRNKRATALLTLGDVQMAALKCTKLWLSLPSSLAIYIRTRKQESLLLPA